MKPIHLLDEPGDDRHALETYLRKLGHLVEAVGGLPTLADRLAASGGTAVVVARGRLLDAAADLGFLMGVPTVVLGAGDPVPALPGARYIEDPFYLDELARAVASVTATAASAVPPARPPPAPALAPAAAEGTTSSLLRGLAHALNNPVAAILGWVQLLEIELAPSEPSRRTVQSVHAEIRRLEMMSQAIAVVGQRQLGPSQPVDFGMLLERQILRLRGEGIEAVLAGPQGAPPWLVADPRELELMLGLLTSAFIEERSRVRKVTIAWASDDGGLTLSLREPGGTIPAAADPSDLGSLLRLTRHNRALGIAVAHAVVARRAGGAVRLRPDPAGAGEIVLAFPATSLYESRNACRAE